MDAQAQSEITYLRSLHAIRERCSQVHQLAAKDDLQFFQYHPEKEADVIQFCIGLMERDFGLKISEIPPHGRWSHLDAGRPRVDPLISQWRQSDPAPDDREICKRLLDLFLVSVLLDAGAGNDWKYREEGYDATYSRSEGLGVASINMFEKGFFSGTVAFPHRVDAAGLDTVTPEKTAAAMQVSLQNPMSGIDGRATLLKNLANALRSKPQYFGEDARPGNILNYLETKSTVDATGTRRFNVSDFWDALVDGLSSIWPPSRTTLHGIPLGDVWPCDALKKLTSVPGEELVPFHKLTGWTTYSLLKPIQTVLHWIPEGVDQMTGLPEYRNGGLLIDFGVLKLRPDALPASAYIDTVSNIPKLPPSHPAIIEWRAMTVIELDRIAEGIRRKLGVTAQELSLAQVLESATWKGGREIAKIKRPTTGGPPIEIESDGTVF